VAPINRIPPEVLSLVPDFFDMGYKTHRLIALTHVCRAWRETFISCSSLWTDFHYDDLNADLTRVFLERSKSSPISLWISEEGDLSPHSMFLQVVPHAIGRLRSLDINGTVGNLHDITAHLSQSAPLLEDLSINGNCISESRSNPILTTALFNGDLPSLCKLHLQFVFTELPWRNVANLTSFELCYTLPGDVPIRRFLDFFESTPRLRKIKLLFATPTSGAQNGRLVSLACLRWMSIVGDEPPSLLLDHLLIPVGAKLTTQADSRGPLFENLLPRSLDNLRNLPDFTDTHIRIDEFYPRIRFGGPNGRITVTPVTPQGDATRLVLESLAQFDTSKTERLRIDSGSSPSSDPPYRALLPMKHLHTLTLSHCTSPETFIHALDPRMSSSGVLVCPELEDLILVLRRNGETLNIKDVMEMAAARALRGAKLKSVRIASREEFTQIDVVELRKHVWQVEHGPGVGPIEEEDEEEG
jgi:hypothetical protein